MNDVRRYLSLPWTIERSERTDDGHYFVLTVAELPGFVVAGRSEEEVEQEFWPALESFIESYLEDGQEPPLPARVRGVVRRPAVVRPPTASAADVEAYSAGDPAGEILQLPGVPA
ncbi:MAG: type II toxin-antitoxin system HicB family antitoxin [Gemmatimonadetes bacterium]|nr:type II toxin-antitoxin system HicB family antitoxin [Gemmatimonadota bacterium]